METVTQPQLFNAEEARKLAKEVKDKKELLAKQEQEDKKQSIAKLVEPIIGVYLENIKKAIALEKEYTVENLDGLDDLIIYEIINRIKELGFYVRKENFATVDESDYQTLTIYWREYKLTKTRFTDKEARDLYKKIFNKPDEYFENKPVYWFHERIPTEFFL